MKSLFRSPLSCLTIGLLLGILLSFGWAHRHEEHMRLKHLLGAITAAVLLHSAAPQPAQAQTPVSDTVFSTAPNTAAVSAGSTLYNGYVDVTGNQFSINAGALALAATEHILARPASEASATQTLIVTGTASSGLNLNAALKLQGGNNCYEFEYNSSGQVVLWRVLGGAVAGTDILVNTTGLTAGVAGHQYQWQVSCSGTTTVSFTYRLSDLTAATTLVNSTYTDTARPAALSGSGVPALMSGAVTRATTYNAQFGVSPLTVASPAINNTSPTSILISGTAATGGTVPYTYQWYRATSKNGGVGAALAGQTALTLTDTTAAAGQVYWYTLAATDSAALTAFSPAVSGSLASAAPIILGVIGDSNSGDVPSNSLPGNTNTSTYMATDLGVLLGGRPITLVNAALGGSSTTSWLPTDASNRLLNVEPTFSTAGVTLIEINHGTNDTYLLTTPATYQSNLTTIITHLYAHIPTLQQVVLDGSIYLQLSPNATAPAGSSNNYDVRNQILLSYQASLKNLANGRTILLGDLSEWRYTGLHPELVTTDGGVHLNASGIQAVGQLRANGIANALYAATLPLSGGTKRRLQ